MPAVIAVQPPEALDVITDVAQKLGAPLSLWGEDYEAFEQRGRLVFQSAERLLDLPLPALMGHHQIANAGTAVAAALHLDQLAIDDRAIERGLLDVRWPARMQQLNNGLLSRLLVPGSELWLDGGHNVAGGQAVAQTLAELEERAPKPVALVLGMMGQKDAHGFLEHFRGLVRRVVTVPIPGGPEAAHEPGELACHRRLDRLQCRACFGCGNGDPQPAGGRGGAPAHPDLRLALSRRPRPGAAGRRAGADELIDVMQISLTPEQREWLEAKVAAGQFGSLEEAAAAAIADSMAGEIDDMAWAKAYVDEARAAVARGDVLTIEEHRARIARRLSKT